MDKVTQEEYFTHYNRINKHLRFIEHPEYNNVDFIKERVKVHFDLFLNNWEKESIKQLIIQNYKENHGYIAGDYLTNGNTIYWEIETVVGSIKKKCNTAHMDKYYSEEYKAKFLDIIKTKKL